MTPIRLLTIALKLAALVLVPGCSRLFVDRGPRGLPPVAGDATLTQASGQRRG